jgi:hypothetical protein
MKTCKDCRFWGTSNEWKLRETHHYMKQCGLIPYSEDLHDEDTPTVFTVSYEESYLYTREDFGCVLFEEK